MRMLCSLSVRPSDSDRVVLLKTYIVFTGPIISNAGINRSDALFFLLRLLHAQTPAADQAVESIHHCCLRLKPVILARCPGGLFGIPDGL